jgi:hypothetical protein
MKTGLALALALAALAPALARADRRYYAETYNAATAEPGGLDVELWSTLYRAPEAGEGVQLWEHQLELETGLTERWDLALYNVFQQAQGGPFQYQATKLESRYRLSEPGQWFVDPVLYLEVKKEWTADKPIAVEGKVILAKDIGPVNLSVNGLAEVEFIPGGGREYEYGYALGASYEVAPWVRLGGEAFGFWTRAGGETVSRHFVGPALSLALSRTWLVLGAGFGLNDASERARLRAILAFQF